MSKVTLYRRRDAHGRKGCYYAKWLQANGTYRHASLEVTDKETATKIRDEMQRRMALERFDIPQECDFTHADAWDEYAKLVHRDQRLLNRERCYWDQFWAMTGLPTLRSVKRGDVADWQKQLLTRESPNRPVTVNTKTRTIAAVYSKLIKEDVYDGPNPFSGRVALNEGRKKFRVIPWDVLEATFKAAEATDKDLYLAVILGVMMGLRKNECLHARWEDINWERREFHIVGTKTVRSDDILPLHDAIYDRLLPHRRDSGYIVRPEKKQGHYIYRWEFRDRWEALKDSMKISEARFHDLRHSFATRLLDLGYPMKDIARMLRHTSTRMTERYADLRTVKVKIGRIDSQKVGTES